MNTEKMPSLLLQRRPWFIAIFQAWLVICSVVLAWLLRFDFSLPYSRTLLIAMPILVVVRVIAMTCFKLHRGWWKYAGISEAADILKAVMAGSAVFFVGIHYVLRLTSFPRTIYVLEALFTAGLLVGVRLLSRVVAESVRENLSPCKKVIVIGAGSAAQTIIREMRRSGSGYSPVGCLDDDRSKLRIRINGVTVLGTVDQLPPLVSSEGIDEVLIAVPSATGQQMRRFVEICEKARVKFRTVPALKDIIAGQVIVRQLREVSLEDLLGREPIQIDLESVRKEIAGRTIVVTGAAGSIGSELCRQIMDYSPARLLCLDQSETGLFFLRLDLDRHANGVQLAFRVADITDGERIRYVLSEFRPDVIFHAAAYKHVPMMECNVQEAVKNNVLGLLGLLDLADAAGCKNFVLISSDKAVNPTNVMGATKRICELILSSRPPNGMRCVSVRFGNVLGSSGSVIPVLKQQLQSHEPLTVTHPEIKRFFMMTREAIALVLQAFAIGKHGDILVLDMGEPVKILDLARTLIRLSGKSEHDVEIRFTGLREGEKLKEELFYEHEKVIPTACERIKRTSGTLKDWSKLYSQLEELRASMNIDGAAPIRAKIKEIVPGYSYLEIPQASDTGDTRVGNRVKKAAASD
ncbi:MAG TPA: nucleoside-diphosphate sugar epimerase/dehydratase [Candidatus Acidoferrum sp.]|nr:nucleoside-diphosphate sugar epimerase/dehydratase [Candidatus Acidoferrum sp.]